MKFRDVIDKMLRLFNINFHIKIQVWHTKEDMMKGDIEAHADFTDADMAKRLYGDCNCEQVAFTPSDDKLLVWLIDPSPDDTDDLQVVQNDFT